MGLFRHFPVQQVQVLELLIQSGPVLDPLFVNFIHSFAKFLYPFTEWIEQLVYGLFILNDKFLALIVQNSVGQVFKFSSELLLNRSELLLLLSESFLLRFGPLSRGRQFSMEACILFPQYLHFALGFGQGLVQVFRTLL